MQNRECETWIWRGSPCINKDLKELWKQDRVSGGWWLCGTFCPAHWDKGNWFLINFAEQRV